MKTKLIITILITAFVSAALIGGCAPGPVEIEEVITCKNVDSNYKPVEPTTVFSSGTNVIFVSVKFKNMTTEDKITTKWNYLETGEEINTSDFTTDTPGSGYIVFSLTTEDAFPSGRYNAVVYLNNKEVKTVEFSVE